MAVVETPDARARPAVGNGVPPAPHDNIAAQPAVRESMGPAPAAAPDVGELLRAYAGSLELARRPPASLAFGRRLNRLHMRLRPTFGCRFFVTRHVRRRLEILERALERRAAVGEAAAGADLDALRSFRASLDPPPSRAWALAVLVGAILASQAIVGALLSSVGQLPGLRTDSIGDALNGISLSPDLKSISDISRTLGSANVLELGLLVLTVLLVNYALGRPLACGYRLAQLCLGERTRLNPRRRSSPLCEQGSQLRIAELEAAASRKLSVTFPHRAPLDALVKTVPVIAVGFTVVVYVRWDVVQGVSTTRVLAWLAASAAACAVIAWPVRRSRLGRRARWRALSNALAVAALVALFVVAITNPLPNTDEGAGAGILLALLGLALARLAWLACHLPRLRSALWLLVPLAAVVAIAASARDVPIYDRATALNDLGLSDVPKLTRHDLQLVLTSRAGLAHTDLRTQDLHALSLRGRNLVEARLSMADLHGADLSHADLRGADLRGAIARDAKLRHADLRGAKLRCADLAGADLSGALLDGADVKGALFDGRTLGDTSGMVDGREARANVSRQVGLSADSETLFYVGVFTSYLIAGEGLCLPPP